MQKEVRIITSDDDAVLPSPYTTEGLWHLLNCHWWRRAWILQEVLLSPHTLVYCGSSEPINWNVVIAGSKIATILRASSYVFVDDPLLNITPEVMCGKLEKMFRSTLSVPFRRLDGNSSLRNMLAILRSQESTDPRDKIYAGLGLLASHQGLEVDFDISVPDLYMLVTKLCIQQERNLNILSMCAPYEDSNIPSWVPDLSITSSVNPRSLSEDSGIRYSANGKLAFGTKFTEKGTYPSWGGNMHFIICPTCREYYLLDFYQKH
jgi:hypothetical protein